MSQDAMTVWLCGDGPAVLRESFCHELRARLLQRGVPARLEARPGAAAAVTPAATCTLVVVGPADTLDAGDGAARSIRVCLHPHPCSGGLAGQPSWSPVAAGVDQALTLLEGIGAISARPEDVRAAEEMMVQRLYDLGYL